MKCKYMTEVMKYRELFDTYKARYQNKNATILKVKNGLDAEKIESRFSQLRDCDSEYVVRFLDVFWKEDELLVVIPSRVDRIGCDGGLRLLFTLYIHKEWKLCD